MADRRGRLDREMQILPADPAAVALAGTVAGDAVTSALEAAELLDVDVDDLAGVFAFIATDRLGRLQGLQGVEPQAPQDAADGGWRDTELGGDLLACVAPPAQGLDRGTRGLRSLAWQ